MNLYAGFLRKSFLQRFMFRSEVVLEILGNLIQMLVRVSIWTALLAGGSQRGITLETMITYTILGFIVGTLTRTNLGNALAGRVQSGMIALDLIRPVNLKFYLMCEDFSNNLYRLITSGVIVTVVSVLVWEIMPAEPLTLAAFIVAVMLGVWIMYSIDFAMGMLVFWTENATFLRMAKSGLFTVFAGHMIPLWFYPDWLLRITNFLPFRFVVFEPIAIYTGYASMSVGNILLVQLLWIAILAVIQMLMWSRVRNRIFVQGG